MAKLMHVGNYMAVSLSSFRLSSNEKQEDVYDPLFDKGKFTFYFMFTPM